jgi:hypothetical protein
MKKKKKEEEGRRRRSRCSGVVRHTTLFAGRDKICGSNNSQVVPARPSWKADCVWIA